MSETSARLIVRQGPYPNQEYELTQPTVVVGRGPNNDIVFADPEVSRQHAQFVQEGEDAYLLKDLGSTNGSFINGQRVSGSTRLQHGDTISLGESIILTFELPGGEYYDDDETPTAEIDVQLPAAQPEPAFGPSTAEAQTLADYREYPAAYPPSLPTADESGRRGRPVLIGCGVALLLVFLCLATLFVLDAYDNGRLLYCGGLRPLWEFLLGPFGFAPICG